MTTTFHIDPNAIIQDAIAMVPARLSQVLADTNSNFHAVMLAIVHAYCAHVENAFNTWLADATNVETHMLEWASIRLMEEWQRRVTAELTTTNEASEPTTTNEASESTTPASVTEDVAPSIPGSNV